jgi:hypothetical protein
MSPATTSRAGRLLMAGIALATSLWFRQVIGAQAPLAALWQQSIKQGMAATRSCSHLLASAPRQWPDGPSLNAVCSGRPAAYDYNKPAKQNSSSC